MKHDPITGPISKREFKALVEAPHGEAQKVIRKYDPLYGLAPGVEVTWWVTFERHARETGRATVKAATLKEAQELAEEMNANQIDWEPDYRSSDCGEIVSVELPDND